MEGKVFIVRLLIEHYEANPADKNDPAILYVTGYADTGEEDPEAEYEIAKLLLSDPRVDPSVNRNQTLKSAFKNNFKVAKLLLQDKRMKLTKHDSEVIVDAAIGGNVELLQLLLEYKQLNPAIDHNRAVREAVKHVNVGAVKLLLDDKRIDASDNNNATIKETEKVNKSNKYHQLQFLLENRKINSREYERRIDKLEDDSKIIALMLYNDKKVRAKLSSKEIKKYEAMLGG